MDGEKKSNRVHDSARKLIQISFRNSCDAIVSVFFSILISIAYKCEMKQRHALHTENGAKKGQNKRRVAETTNYHLV